MRKYLASLALVMAASSAMAVDTFDPASNKLTLDSVVVNGTVYNNVVITVNSYALNAVGTSAPYSAVTAKCTAANFTNANYNAIALGMSFAQVTNIMGCVNSPTYSQHQGGFTIYGWSWMNPTTLQTMLISVWFDATGNTVTDAYSGQGPTTYFKSSSGF